MPFPIVIPFAIKGAIVLGKYILSHHAGLAVAKGAAAAVHTMGAAQATTLAATGLTIVGFGIWSVERIIMCETAIEHASKGDLLQAANEFSKLARSFSVLDGGSLVDDLKAWLAQGCDIASPLFGSIVSGAREVLDEAARTSRTLKPA